MIKIYELIFIRYTNSMRSQVKTQEGEYLEITNPFLIKECDIEAIKKYGGGIKELKYVGCLKEFS